MTHLTRGAVLMWAALIPAALILFVLVSGFLAQVPWAADLWPWPAKPLSYIFIASILAAIAVPVLWIALTGEAAAIRAGALDLTVMYGGMFVYVLTLIGDPREPRLWTYALAFGLAAAGSAGAFLFARQIPWADPRPMPRPVRLSFGAFAMILIGAGVALLLQASIFPWRLGAETSVMFGLVFLGAATYFIYGALDPHWGNAVGQLAGFLAYDLVLLAPFLEHFQHCPRRLACQPDNLRRVPRLQRDASQLLFVRVECDSNSPRLNWFGLVVGAPPRLPPRAPRCLVPARPPDRCTVELRTLTGMRVIGVAGSRRNW